MRPGQLRPGVRPPRELAGTAPFSSWSEKSENRATPYAPGPRFLPWDDQKVTFQEVVEITRPPTWTACGS